jgi:lipopolysaccharide transport system ATP-binding protein
MYVRLAFAVAAHLQPEILIVDEVLAVGDAEFQKKCLGKMEKVAAEEGRTVLFVSHNMGAVSQLCTRGLLMAGGRLVASGSVGEVIRQYSAQHSSGSSVDLSRVFRGPLCARLKFESLRVGSETGVESNYISPSSEIRIEALAKAEEAISSFRTTLGIFSNGVRLFSMHDVQDGEPIKAGTAFKSSFVIPRNFLRPGDYFVALGGHSETSGEWLWATDIVHFTVLEEWNENYKQYDTGVVNLTTIGRRETVAAA